MLMGKSVLHVNQNIGTCFSRTEIKGYYNNMTEKVTMESQLLECDRLPEIQAENGDNVIFPVAVFQYALGAYDMYIQNGDDKFLTKFLQCVEWTYNNIQPDGSWNNFFFNYPEHPFGAMAQGEGASLLIRGYKETGDEKYLAAAKSAIDFMLVPVGEGGTADYREYGIVLLEFTHLAAVMNGWIFAWFGLYDYVLVTGDNGKYKASLDSSTAALERLLPSFTSSYWSMYDLAGNIASPFYHNLHIAQMQALYELTGSEIFNSYAEKWQGYQKKTTYRNRAFIKKAMQKIMEK